MLWRKIVSVPVVLLSILAGLPPAQAADDLALAEAPTAAGATGHLAQIRARGALRLLSFPDQESDFIRVQVELGLGHYEGIDYDLMHGFAESLGLRLEVVPARTSFGDLLPMLLEGKGDVVGSSLSITAERRRKVDFSAPYFVLKTVVVARRGSPFKAPADLAGKTGSTVPASSHHELIKAIPNVKVHFVDFARWNLDSLMEGTADFTLLDEPQALALLSLYPDLEVVFELPEVDSYGFAVPPGSDLLPHLDRYLDEARRSGRLDDIVRRYLGPGASSGAPAPAPK